MIEPNEVFVDVGANFGWHSLSLLVNRPDVLMSYAYEPSPDVYSLLTENIRANNCQDRCHAKQLALSNKKGRTTLKTFDGLDSMYASLYPLADSSFKQVKST